MNGISFDLAKETSSIAIEAIKERVSEISKSDDSLIYHAERESVYQKLFMEHYQTIMDNFMINTESLDWHKQAAIITITTLESEIVTTKDSANENTEINILPEIVAIDVALSYMNDCLNVKIANKGIGKPLKKYYLPVAFSCNTKYVEILCRMLYYEKNGIAGMSFNVLELSDRYFLMEYINLIQNGIEPMFLKEEPEE